MSEKTEFLAVTLHAIADRVKEYDTAKTAGVKAGIADRITNLQLDLVLAGHVPGKDFTLWVNPTAVKSSRTPISEDELRSDIAAAYGVLSDKNMPEQIRAAADKRISSLLRKSNTRDYGIADPRKTAKTAQTPAVAA